MSETAAAAQRLAIYARVSTEEQREGQTIDSQIAELERFAREKCWPVAATYRDDGWSGGVMERPELDRLRDDARKGFFDAVLINDVDRLARDVAHLGVIKRDLERQGIRVVFRKLPTDQSPTSNLMVNILGSFAEFERELISDRTRRGRRHKVEVRKQYLGSNTAYGYRYLPMDRLAGKEGVLQIEPAEAKIVRQMFAWVDREGLSARRVLLRLNELKVEPRNGGPSWAKSSVLRVLHCETYAGIWHYNKFQSCEPRNPTASVRYRRRVKCSIRQRPKSEWLPLELPESLKIIPRDQWERVQQRLRENFSFSPRNEKHRYLLKSLVHCGGCAARYVGDPSHGKYYYRCSKRCKKFPAISAHILDQTVKDAVTRVLVDPMTILEPLRKLNEIDAHEAGRQSARRSAAEREARGLETEEQRILDAYRTALISPAQLATQLEKLRVRRAALQLHADGANDAAKVAPEEIERSVATYCAEAVANLANFSEDEWTNLLRTIIESIVFQGKGVLIRGKIPAGELEGGARLDVEAEVRG